MEKKTKTIYDRATALEKEVKVLRMEVDILKKALRNKIARHEISEIKKGANVSTIL
ncbi:MAG: hypothetical protein R1F52_05910 [Candidatus Nitrosoabyssus spongiisocia]|nr:MAG: hypothetical protein R1F52_05910 [Nitrosopumilaceae archaeon AB1(1)]